MIKWIKILSLAILAFGIDFSLNAEHMPASQPVDELAIQSVTVDGKSISLNGIRKWI